MTPAGHATGAPPRWQPSVFTDTWGSLRGRLGAKIAGKRWASEQEVATAGIRAGENRCEKAPRAAAEPEMLQKWQKWQRALGKFCGSGREGGREERKRRISRVVALQHSPAMLLSRGHPRVTSLTSPSHTRVDHGHLLSFLRPVHWPGTSIGQVVFCCSTAVLRRTARTGEVDTPAT
jgi:hypothetical protein